MPNGQLAFRVDSLEECMKELSYQGLKTEMELAQLSAEMRDFKDEMKAFKDEMIEFKDEMKAFKDEMKAFKDEMIEFKDEMKAFKDEMIDFKDEMKVFKDEMSDFKDEMRTFKTQAELDRREMNRKWGELANKMGTMVEDLVAPNIPRIAAELFDVGKEGEFSSRVKRYRGSNTLEIDFLAVYENVVLINETRSRLSSGDVDRFADKLLAFREFYPEFADRRVVGILASLYVDESIVRYATRRGILAMGMADDTMKVLNPEVVDGLRR